jgi:hypothetical protein
MALLLCWGIILAPVGGHYVVPVPVGPPKPYLADDNSSAVPLDILKKGEAVIDLVGEAVKSAFPLADVSVAEASGGEYERLMGAEVFNLASVEPKLDHALYPTVTAFVEASVAAAKKNPILIELAAQWGDLSLAEQTASYPAKSPERDADIRDAVVLAYVEAVVTHAAMHEPKTADGGILGEMVSKFVIKRNDMTHDGVPEWAKFSDAFEELKRVSVDAAIATMLEYKKDTGRSKELFQSGMRSLVTFDGLKPRAHAEVNSGILLSLNILEAMYEDVRRVWQAENNKTVPVTAPICGQNGAPPQNSPGKCLCFGGDPANDTNCGPPSSFSHDNAEAGIALVLHASKLLIPGTNRHRACETGPSSNQACDGILWRLPSTAAALPQEISAEFVTKGRQATGALKLSSPFPQAWNNLYNSWNGAFVSGYVDAPIFYTKLFNPVVAGFYHSGEPTMYMWPRVYTLYMIVQYMNVLERVRLQRNMVTRVQWNRAVLTELWGKVNLKASKEYRDRLAAAWLAAPNAWSSATPQGLVFDAIKKIVVTSAYAKLDLTVAGWHALAEKVSEGLSPSSSQLENLVWIAQILTGLEEMVGGIGQQQEYSDDVDAQRTFV